MAKKQYIGIKKIWYTDVVTAALTPTSLYTLLQSANEVKNSHQDTWGYEESDPNTTEYVNELTGATYYIDEVQGGIPTISFTMGEYDYTEKADLQGGSALDSDGNETTDADSAVGWARPTTTSTIEKCVIALTKTGNYVCLTRAHITGAGKFVEKNIGLGVSAKALENETSGVASEYWYDGDQVTASE